MDSGPFFATDDRAPYSKRQRELVAFSTTFANNRPRIFASCSRTYSSLFAGIIIFSMHIIILKTFFRSSYMKTWPLLLSFIQTRPLSQKCIFLYIFRSTFIGEFGLFVIVTFNVTTIYDGRLGPLINHWAMRYEAKHQYFKLLAQMMGNFINVPYSLSMRHQCLQAYLGASGSISDIDSPLMGKGATSKSVNTTMPALLKHVYR